jgi:PAS domain S-box-containing protein
MNASEGLHTRDLEQRLSEAEATIQALLSGQIDAVVDATSQTPVLLAKAQEALQASLGEFRSLAEAMPQIVWITRPDGANVYFNHQWMDYTGLTLEESLGDGWSKPFHQDDQQRAWDAWQQATTTVGAYSIECRLRRADGVYRWWLVRGVPLQDTSGTILKWFGTCTDIHDLKLANLEISRFNRALGMLSRCNGALIRTTREPDLLNEICQIVVEAGGYRMAWIGYAQDDESPSITPMAHAGVEEGYLTETPITWNVNKPHGQGPAGEAIRTGHAVVCDDLERDHQLSGWLAVALRRGYRRNICLPLRDSTHTFGVLALYAAEVHQTSAGELKLLQEMADNLAFGIGKVRAESERARLEMQVREQAALLDIAHEAILVKDLDGRIVYWNKGAERTYGWSAADAVGRSAAELFHHDAGFQEARTTVLARGEWRGEQVRLTKTGHELTLDARWTLVRDRQGQPTSILAIVTDITERKRAADTLRAAEERVRFALDTANVGIWDMDCRTGALTWSHTLEAHYGLEAGGFGGTFEAFVELIHPDDRESVLTTVGPAMKSGAEFSVAHRALWRDGTVQWLTGAGRFFIGGDGNPVRGVGISQNVTDRRMLERQYQQAQKMEAIGQLASGVAHDFNNLLTVIQGFAQFVAEDVTLHQRHSNDLGEIIKAAERAAALTKQLLAFSRQQVLQTAPLDVNHLLTNMTGMLGRLIGEHIQISLVLAPSLSLALADPGQLEQVVMNLVVNARDAMPGGGLVTIETADVELENSTFHQEVIMHGQYVMLAVTDSGSGMSDQTKQHLFEPFFTTKESGKGTGLGLSTTYGIVKQSNGYIWVYSEPGRGTAFKVYLPRANRDAIAATASVAVTAPMNRPSQTVLLVEDEAGVRLLSKRILDNAGYRVLVAANGDDAESVFAQHTNSIDLVVTDVVMPGCGGPELLGRLQHRVPALRVLYMSGYTEQSAASAAGIDRGVPFVQKPFTAAEFVRQVREALDR